MQTPLSEYKGIQYLFWQGLEQPLHTINQNQFVRKKSNGHRLDQLICFEDFASKSSRIGIVV
jgi:hypothetical protein